MIKIKYVGVKENGERAFQHDTGIEWFPGDVKDVKEEHAALMLRHPDVFEQVSGDAVEKAPAPVLRAVASDDLDADDEQIRKEEAEKKAAADAADTADGSKVAPESAAKAPKAPKAPKGQASPKRK